MPMKMSIHRKPMGRDYLAFLDSRIRGNDGGMFFLGKRLRNQHQAISMKESACDRGFQLRSTRTWSVP